MVDGAAVTAEGGKVNITGEIGSVHLVNLTLGERAFDQAVVISRSGLMPARAELPALPAPTPTASVAAKLPSQPAHVKGDKPSAAKPLTGGGAALAGVAAATLAPKPAETKPAAPKGPALQEKFEP